jgi:hypothetical protein
MVSAMAMTLDQIVEETSQLPADVVAELVDRILLSRHEGIAPDLEADWKTGVHRRIEELETRKAQGVPAEESLARVRKIIGQ